MQKQKHQLKLRQIELLVGQLDLSQVEEAKEALRQDGRTLLCFAAQKLALELAQELVQLWKLQGSSQ